MVPFPRTMVAYAATWYAYSYCTGGASATRTKKRDVNRNMVPFSPNCVWHMLLPGMHAHTVQEAHPRQEQRKETSTEIWFLFPRTMAYTASYAYGRLILSTLEYTGRRLIREPVLCYYIILLYLQPALTKPYYYHVYAVHPLVILTRADCMHSTHSLYFCWAWKYLCIL